MNRHLTQVCAPVLAVELIIVSRGSADDALLEISRIVVAATGSDVLGVAVGEAVAAARRQRRVPAQVLYALLLVTRGVVTYVHALAAHASARLVTSAVAVRVAVGLVTVGLVGDDPDV